MHLKIFGRYHLQDLLDWIREKEIHITSEKIKFKKVNARMDLPRCHSLNKGFRIVGLRIVLLNVFSEN